MLNVTIAAHTVSVLNRREHWSARAKRAKSHRELAKWTLCATWTPIPAPWVVTLTRIAPRELDRHDNLSASMKACADGVADFLGINDRDPRVTWRYAQEKGKPREYAVRIEVEAA